MEETKKILITVGSGLVSFWVFILWMVMAMTMGILLMVDWIYKVWTKRRITWIQHVSDWVGRFFTNPFGTR